MNELHRTTDNVVIGGGLAGSMLALRLAAAGREVTLLEKERGPHHKVCGEFLSGEAVEYLRDAGVDPLTLGAETIRTVRLAAEKIRAEAPLPFTALSISRCLLDEAVLARTAECGCRVERGACVHSLDPNVDGWTAQLRDGSSWRSHTAFLACGKHDLSGAEGRNGAHGGLVGFKLHWRLRATQTAALHGAMELFLFRGGYGGLSLVESELANLCLVVRRSVLQARNGWSGLLSAIREENASIAERLEGASPQWQRPLAIFPIPYGYLARRAGGLWRLGDQAAVIPSFTGDGMSIALHSAALAAKMYFAGESADDYQQELARQLRRSMLISCGLSKAMVNGFGRTVAPLLLSFWPDAMREIAAWTRIPGQALAASATR
jgi:menaquinone-9 beta-reductase